MISERLQPTLSHWHSFFSLIWPYKPSRATRRSCAMLMLGLRQIFAEFVWQEIDGNRVREKLIFRLFDLGGNKWRYRCIRMGEIRAPRVADPGEEQGVT